MRKLNVAVYESLASAGIKFPNIPIYASEHYGQCAEDIVVKALLSALSFRFGGDLSSQRYLEIGGNHPVATSATYLLNRTLGMRGVIVEANPRLIEDLQRHRPDDLVVHGAVQTENVDTVVLTVSNLDELSSVDRSFVTQWDSGRVGEREQVTVPALLINSLFETYFGDRAPLFLAIDIEGLDLEVLQGLDFEKYRPAVIQAEPSDHHLHENSRRMVEFLNGKGYSLVARTEVNLIFADTGVWRTNEEGAVPSVADSVLFELQERARVAETSLVGVQDELAQAREALASLARQSQETQEIFERELTSRSEAALRLEVEKLRADFADGAFREAIEGISRLRGAVEHGVSVRGSDQRLIAKEVWWERNRRSLLYRISAFFRRT